LWEPIGATRTKVAAAYLAGYFDGEGCITVDSGLRLLVTATFPQSCLGLQEAFGGKVVERKSDPGEKTQYQWTVYGLKAYNALLALIPYLHEKQEQAIHATWWYASADDPMGRALLASWIKKDKHCSWSLPLRYNDPPEPIHVEV